MMQNTPRITTALGAIVTCAFMIAATVSADALVENVTPAEETQWLRHLLPLPHTIDIRKKVILAPGDIGITLRTGAGETEQQAVAELQRLFQEKTGQAPNGKQFEIVIGIAGDDIELNHEQGYVIEPAGDRRLVLNGVTDRGAYYAVMTLYQLLEPFMTETSVTIPLARVRDWPDIEERGLWNYPPDWMPWLTSMKLNYGRLNIKLAGIKRGRPNRIGKMDMDLYQEAQRRAFHALPDIIHLNFLHRRGLFRAYPELAGIGDSALAGRYFAHKTGNQHRAPCASQPLLTDLIAEWMTDFATKGVTEICCWLSERPCQCACNACTAVGQFVLESRVFVNAWRQVQKTHPEFKIRLLLSTTTAVRNYRILEELPPEIKIERACATELERVAHMPRDLFRNPLLDEYAAGDRWIASYDVPLNVNGDVATPEFKLPHSSAHRIKDYLRQLHRRNYKGAEGMMAWRRHAKKICGFNIAAHAEWSWNLNGRSEKEFAIAWATRQGYADPDAVGEWSELMGPVEFDVYDSDFPACYSWGKAADMVKQRRRPFLGEGIFRYYSDPEDFNRKIAVCEKALEIAAAFADPYLASETRVVLSYVKLAQMIYETAEQLAVGDIVTPDGQKQLRTTLKQLGGVGAENVAAIKAWRTSLGPEQWHHRVHDAIKGTESTVAQIVGYVESNVLY